MGACEFAHEIDPDKLRYVMKVQNGAGGDYHWVTCGACDCSWQVPFFAESVG